MELEAETLEAIQDSTVEAHPCVEILCLHKVKYLDYLLDKRVLTTLLAHTLDLVAVEHM
jgi:hypothetical protein